MIVVISSWSNMLAPSEIEAISFVTSHLICIKRISVFSEFIKQNQIIYQLRNSNIMLTLILL